MSAFEVPIVVSSSFIRNRLRDTDAKRKLEITEGKFLSTPKGLKWTYEKLLDRYLEYAKVTKMPRTYKTDLVWAKNLRAAFGTTQLKDMTVATVDSYIAGKLQSDLAPATVLHHLALLKHSFTMAVKWRLLAANSLRDVRLPVKVKNDRVRYLTADERARLLAVCGVRLKRVVLTALHTGMRKSEIFNLRWDQINLVERFVLLPDSKNGDSRGVPITETMIGVLQNIRAEQDASGQKSPWVFPSPVTGKPMRYDTNTAWRTAQRKSGIEDFRFHDLRHTTASYLRMAGVDLLTIKEILGHKDIRMTARYAHISPTHRLDAIGKLDQAYKDASVQTKPALIAAGATSGSKNGSNHEK
jgi:integrase